MDLQKIATRTVAAGMRVAGTGKKSATLHITHTAAAPTGPGAYDPDTDTTAAPTTGTSDLPVKGIFYRQAQRQGEGATGRTAQFFVEGADAPNGIDEADTITVDGKVWNIYDVDNVQNEAGYMLFLRR